MGNPPPLPPSQRSPSPKGGSQPERRRISQPGADPRKGVTTWSCDWGGARPSHWLSVLVFNFSEIIWDDWHEEGKPEVHVCVLSSSHKVKKNVFGIWLRNNCCCVANRRALFGSIHSLLCVYGKVLPWTCALRLYLVCKDAGVFGPSDQQSTEARKKILFFIFLFIYFWEQLLIRS